jgi:hypothetical protein
MRTAILFIFYLALSSAAQGFAPENDTIESNASNLIRSDTLPLVADDTYWNKLGRTHANKFFRENSTGAGLGAFACGASLVFTPVAVMIFASPPKEKHLNYPDSLLWQNPSYREGYKKKAQQIKHARVAGGYFAGLITLVAGAALVVSNMDFSIGMGNFE